MNNFKEEAIQIGNQRYPVTQKRHEGSGGMWDVNESKRIACVEGFISGAEYGFQHGIEEGMRFAEWCDMKAAFSRSRALWAWYDDFKYSTTAELLEIYKKEQNDK